MSEEDLTQEHKKKTQQEKNNLTGCMKKRKKCFSQRRLHIVCSVCAADNE